MRRSSKSSNDARSLGNVIGFAGSLMLALIAGPRPTQACAVCGAGDPTLSSMGAERPFAGRLRLAGELRLGSARVGLPGGYAIDLQEQRFDLGVAYAPLSSLFLSVSLPLLRREAISSDRTSATAFGLGDVELRVKYFAWDARRGPYRHQAALQGGLKLPTAPVQYDAHGLALPADLQPGTGAIEPLFGAFYAFTRGPWSFYASATFFMPFAVRDGPHSADSLRNSATLQRQEGRAFAARLGFNTRLDSMGERNGSSDPNSGGFVGFVSPELVWSPLPDWVLLAGAHFPIVQALRGDHREGAILAIGVAYDL